MKDLQGFCRCRWSLEFQRKHASVECQIMQLQSFTKDSEEEGSFGQGVCGNLSLPRRRHFALLALFTIREKNTTSIRQEKKTTQHCEFKVYSVNSSVFSPILTSFHG